MHLWSLCLAFSQAVLSFHVKIPRLSLYGLYLSLSCIFNSELKRRLKAEKKAAEKETKIKEQPVQEACKDEEILDPNVRFIFYGLCKLSIALLGLFSVLTEDASRKKS